MSELNGVEKYAYTGASFGGEPAVPATIATGDIMGYSGAVVTKDVPDNCVVVGAPARVVRELEERLRRIPPTTSGARFTRG